MSRLLNVAVVGATGLVGETMIKVLQERKFPIHELYPIASMKSAGETIRFNKSYIEIIALDDFDFSKVDIALFALSNDLAKEYIPKATEQGCIVIDNSSTYRYDNDVPLVIPEVNPHALANYEAKRIIANPNCSTIQMLVALKPLHDAVGIKRINVATYQSVSGTGKAAVSELIAQVGDLLNGRPAKFEVYPKQIAFNVLPHIDSLQDNGYTREEMKMVWETQKILEDSSILVNPTAVRVPVLYGHSEAIHVEFHAPLQASEAKALLAEAPGVCVIDDIDPFEYPTPISHSIDKDDVFVGRIRNDITHPNGLNLWVVSDNIRKGAATNAVQIAELLYNYYIE